MKKILTLFAMALMAVGTNAQSVIAEVDWTQRTEYYDLWYDWDRCTITVNGDGLVIESNPPEDAEYWHPQAPMIGYIPDIVEGESYQVKFTLNAPAAGEIRLDFASHDGGTTSPCVINVEAGEKEYVVDFPNYPANCAYAKIYYQCGKIPGTHIIKSVKVTVASDSKWTIAGDKDLLGADWDATSNDNTMKTFDGENNTLTKTELKLSEGTYQFKVFKDHATSESYPTSSNASLVINEGGFYNVTFTFNSKTKELSANAEKTEIILYNYDAENKVAEVKNFSTTYKGDIIILSTVIYEGQTYTVTKIADAAGYGCLMASVSIPNTVTYIGSQAFRFCSNMTSVSIPDCVTYIGDYAFFGCSSLTSVELPDELTSIEVYSFQDCSGLTSMRIPNSVSFISIDAFNGCSALESVTIGNHVSLILNAFSNCPKLKDVYCLAESVPTTDAGAFGWCEAQATLHVPKALLDDYESAEPWKNFGNRVGISAVNDGDTFQATVDKTTFKVKVLSAADKTCQIGADGRGDAIVSGGKDWNGVIPSKVIGSDYEEYTVIGIGNRAFFEYGSSVKDLILPKTLLQISEGAFMRCENLMYVTIPAGVKTVGDYVFNGQEVLTEVVSMIEDPDAINGISIDCGGKNGNKATLVVPAGTKSIYQNANGWNHFPRIVEMKAGDANGNADIDEQDKEFVEDFIMNQKPNEFVRKNADTNGDNEINVIDIVNIINSINSSNQ